MKLVFIVVVLAFLKSVLAYKTYHVLPLHELRRRGRGHDHQASAIYKVAALGGTLDLSMWLLGASSAIALILWTARINWWACVITMLLIAIFIFWLPRPRPGGLLWKFAAFASPYYFKVLNLLRPVLDPLARFLPMQTALHFHSGVYEKEDLLELLDAQNHQVDNRVPAEDLKIAVGALTFGDKKVGKVMTPRRKVRFVSESETIGPMLMDELHSTGFSRFPVARDSVKTANPTVTGTLYLRDLVDHPGTGKVKEIVHHDAYFINESCNLRQALDAFFKTKHQLLVVVNNFEEIVGVLTLEDVLEQIISAPITDEFDKYDSLRAVANIEAEREKAAHKEVEAPAEPAEQPEPADE